MEDYAAKMALKPDAALREYVVGYAQYREEAVLAALDELRRRGQPAPEDATLRPTLEATVQQQAAATQAARETTADTAEEELTPLYSPASIVVISAVVSVVAGAFLLGINMYKRKRGNAILGLVSFVLLYLIGEALLLRLLVAQHLFSPFMAFLLDLPLILAYIWWFWPRYVGTYQFQPRNWLLPLGICLLLKFSLAYLLLLNPTVAQMLKQQMEQMQQR
ncbi:hypothetical protein FNT36_11390 [Hymenobacter setariae]|uniref:Uncharacterized protein n=1 Tax=Hymenobacter setariae TaxID=2594794 RepID=A0A558BU99_9BACT|nr:hypothetical protein [Hymenobacter setariae]TVT40097.1 hypothetical protein FNT36_11390 [Hymenobacter setariae]